MSVGLKLISLNIERHKHLALVEKFLTMRMPDVVCLQEVFEHDVDRLLRAIGGSEYAFEPMGKRPDEPSPGIMGIAILSRFPIMKKEVRYYAGERGELRDSTQSDTSTYNLMNRMILASDLEKDGMGFRIATTHFTWTPDGKPDDVQRNDIQNLLRILAELGDFVLMGDFNAPRGGEIFAMLAEHYKDNVPPHYVTSLDQKLHRAVESHPHEIADKMVDGIFSTPNYIVTDIEMICGVSDHCALVATVSKVEEEN